MLKLAARTGRAKPSTIMLIADKAKQLKAEGKDVVNFSIGVPNFLPGDHVYQAVRDWMPRDSGGYGSNRGAPALLDAIASHFRHSGLDGYTRANVTVGIGAKQVLYNLCEALLDEGDEIVFPSPYWTSYVDIAEILNAKMTILECPPEQHYKLTPAQLDKAL
ncbi:MAG TPA: aminotransferase class I/II-fold pyridoxal phosphate-dependent enzyme, partial [Rhodanobacteraceae bacterium]|nr:aminotransferase class I/II-fold pyridoxal phosphate-dependent enzyme [Rhodanobacteraceae bacterium]